MMNDELYQLALKENRELKKINTELLEALKAWMVYYEKHSTIENRDRAYGMSRIIIFKVERFNNDH